MNKPTQWTESPRVENPIRSDIESQPHPPKRRWLILWSVISLIVLVLHLMLSFKEALENSRIFELQMVYMGGVLLVTLGIPLLAGILNVVFNKPRQWRSFFKAFAIAGGALLLLNLSALIEMLFGLLLWTIMITA